MTELKYWLWLSLALYQNSKKISALLERFDNPLEIYNAEREDFYSVNNLNEGNINRLCDKRLIFAEKVMAECRQKGIRIMTFDSPYYPYLLKNIFDPPYVLYVKSKDRIDLNNELTITAVGTREMTDYGQKTAYALAYDLAIAGVTIISGMARGIDGAALSGALDAGGKTVAVLGSGVDIVYPPEHKQMMQQIASNGMVISEYPPGTPPLGKNFPTRNRIISGLSLGSVIIESPEAGGSLITANLALEQGRDVFAVPGNITTHTSDGTNELIRQGAHLTTSALDIISEYKEQYIHIFEKAVQTEQIKPVATIPDIKKPVTALPIIDNSAYGKLSDIEKAILDCLSLVPTHVDTITEKTNLSVSELNATLTFLEMQGLVKQLAGRHFILKL